MSDEAKPLLNFSFLLNALITSKMRIKLLLRFFTQPDASFYLRGLAEEFGDSTNAVSFELRKLQEAGLLTSRVHGSRIMYSVNKKNAFYRDLARLVSRYLGFETIVDGVLNLLDSLDAAYVIGDYAQGIDSGVIEIVLIGQLIEENVLELCAKVERIINRNIRVTIEDKFIPNGPYLRLS